MSLLKSDRKYIIVFAGLHDSLLLKVFVVYAILATVSRNVLCDSCSILQIRAPLVCTGLYKRVAYIPVGQG